MLRAGISLTQCLQALSEQARDPLISQSIDKVKKDIEAGSTFSQALARQPELLPGFYVEMIKAGEEGGVLDDMLDRIAQLLEYENETKARIRSATFYPTLVVGELAIALAVIVKFVFPRFKSLFASRGAALPLPTQVMIVVSDLVEKHGLELVVLLAALAIALRWYRRTPRGRLASDRLAIRMPIFGEIVLKVLMSRFARVLASLLASGMPLVRSLELVEATVGNAVVREEIGAMREGIKRGKGVAGSVKKGGVFPAPVVRMLEVGEKTGSLDEMLFRVSAFFDSQVDYRIRNLTTVLEPILLVVLGVSVLFVALAVFLPMWNLMHVVAGH